MLQVVSIPDTAYELCSKHLPDCNSNIIKSISNLNGSDNILIVKNNSKQNEDEINETEETSNNIPNSQVRIICHSTINFV